MRHGDAGLHASLKAADAGLAEYGATGMPWEAQPIGSRLSDPGLLGIMLVTASTLFFGTASVCVKAIQLPILVLLFCRCCFDWAFSVLTALAYTRMPVDGGARADLTQLLFGPPHLRGWIFLRAFLWWCYVVCLWFALALMPIGDATSIVCVGPVFTALFAFLFAGERIDWTFYPVFLVNSIGVVLIVRPSFIFGGDFSDIDGDTYMLGALLAGLAAVISGSLPVCTRKSKESSWIAINHSSALLSAALLTPMAIFVWTAVDPQAKATTLDGFDQLFGSVHIFEGTSFFHKWRLLLALSGLGYLGLALQTKGYQLEESGRAAVMTVLEMPFAYTMQNIVFGEAASAVQVVGACLICASTLANILRRLQLKQQSAAAA